MDAETVAAWVARYECAWRSPGTGQLAGLFTEGATYREEPYARPVTGLPAIGRMWEDKRDGPAEVFEMASEFVAVEWRAPGRQQD